MKSSPPYLLSWTDTEFIYSRVYSPVYSKPFCRRLPMPMTDVTDFDTTESNVIFRVYNFYIYIFLNSDIKKIINSDKTIDSNNRAVGC